MSVERPALNANRPETDAALVVDTDLSHRPGAATGRGTSPSRPASRGWGEVTIDRAWRFFCSVRAAIWEVAFLATLILIGTLRGSSVPRSLADALPVSGPLVERWYAWDVFHSLLFMLTLALIAVATLIGGMINRAPGIFKAIAHPTVVTTHGFLRGTGGDATLASAASVSATANTLADTLRERRYRVVSEVRGHETHLYVDKNRFARLGTFPFHIALILFMAGGIIGAHFGFRETEFIVAEGESRPIGHGTGLAVRLDRFEDTYDESGIPSEYTSHLTILDGDRPVASDAITVNDPMSHDGVTIYQSSFGQAVRVRVTDLGGSVLYDGAVELGTFTSNANPDAPAGVVVLRPAEVVLTIIAPDQAPLNQPELDALRLADQEIYVRARYTGSQGGLDTRDAVLATRQTADLGAIRVEFLRETRFSLFQVARNPAIPLFIVASVLLVGGLMATFYFPHRRIRGIVSPDPASGGATAHLAPLAKRDWGGQRQFDALLADLAARPDLALVETRPRSAPDDFPDH